MFIWYFKCGYSSLKTLTSHFPYIACQSTKPLQCYPLYIMIYLESSNPYVGETIKNITENQSNRPDNDFYKLIRYYILLAELNLKLSSG